MRPILIGDGEQQTRILRPQEFSELILAIPKLDNQIRVKACLYTGLRIVEIRRFHKQDHTKKTTLPWYDAEHGFIHLPKTSVLKSKRKQMRRYVRLNQPGKEIVPQFLKLTKAFPGKLGDNATWNEDLKRWHTYAGLSTEGVCPKMFRKIWESWLIFYYPNRLLDVIQSQGHTKTTALKHYINTPFTKEDCIHMEPYVSGWI